MVTAVASLLTGKPVRRDLAMTGEITLRGKVLPVGGIKEKVLAASRAGIREVVLPAENRRDLRDVPGNVKKGLRFRFVKSVGDLCRVLFPETCGKGRTSRASCTSNRARSVARRA